MTTIDIESPETWPAELTRHMRDNLALFRSYEAEDDRLDQLRETDRMAFYAASNPYARDYYAAVEAVISIIEPYDVQAFHCTRLCEDEVAGILANGMELPTPSTLDRRVDTRVTAGDIPQAIGAIIKADNLAHHDNRRDMLWFVSGKSALTDEGGLYRLFRHWGGEALYGQHEDNPAVANYLHRTGTPYIIEAALPLSEYEPFFHHRAIYSTYIKSLGMKPSHGTAAEGNIKVAVPAARIRRIIRHGETDFEALTGSSGWYRQIA